jgi:hypothetical protein
MTRACRIPVGETDAARYPDRKPIRCGEPASKYVSVDRAGDPLATFEVCAKHARQLERTGSRLIAEVDAVSRTIRLELPKAFYADHVSRDLPGGEEVSQTARKVTVLMSAEEVAELLSDAEHYTTEARHMGPEYFGLGRSAAATVRAINEQITAKIDALLAADRAAAATYVVVDEHTLGYLSGRHSVGVLASDISGFDPKNGPIDLPTDDARVRPATREDFVRFRVSTVGHLAAAEVTS